VTRTFELIDRHCSDIAHSQAFAKVAGILLNRKHLGIVALRKVSMHAGRLLLILHDEVAAMLNGISGKLISASLVSEICCRHRRSTA
jgi:hypothetical protein